MGTLGAENAPLAIHEYMHLLMRHLKLNVPVWLNEGFAEVYSTLKPVGGRIQLGTPPVGRAVTLAQDKWLPLTRLLSINTGSPEYNEKSHAGILYAQSWLLVHMLTLGDEYRDGFSKFVITLSENPDPAAAFETVYHKKLWQVETGLNATTTRKG